MAKIKALVILLLGLVPVACGPHAIVMKTGLDTPAQHVANGRQLLDRGKLGDAIREFNRAKELDPHYVAAYVGLGITLGLKGDTETGFAYLDQAREMAVNEQEAAEVRNGYKRLAEIKCQNSALPPQQ